MSHVVTDISQINNIMQNTPFVLYPGKGQTNGRTVLRYVLQASDDSSVKAAADAINALFTTLPALVPTFNLKALPELLKNHRVLIINESAVCLHSLPRPSKSTPPEFLDQYFSETLLAEPVRCIQGHCLEKQTAEEWKKRVPHCPEDVNKPHDIGELKIDIVHQETIQNHVVTKRVQEALLSSPIQVNNVQESLDQSFQKTVMNAAYSSLGSSFVAKHVAKRVATAFRIFNPLTSFAYAFKSWSEGRGMRAGAEVASGIAGCMPGIGTAVSLGIDACMLVSDCLRDSSPVKTISPEQAYELFGIETSKESLKKEAFDKAYQAVVKSCTVNRDKFQKYGCNSNEELMSFINAAKAVIYKQHKWT